MSTPTWRIVAEREVRAQVTNKAFVIGVAATLVLAVAGVVVMAVFGNKAPSYDVGVLSAEGKTLAQSSKQFLESDAKVKVTTYDDLKAGEKALKDGDVEVLVAGDSTGWELVGDEEVSTRLGASIATAARGAAVAKNATEQNVDLAALEKGAAVKERTLVKHSEDRGAMHGLGFGMGLLYYVIALIFGIQIAQSVVQEKESRVVEILAAAVPTRALLWGKVVANTVLAIGQATVLVVVVLITMALTGQETLVSSVGPAMLWFLAYFLIGFVALASLWSAAGSLAGRTQDVNSTTMPMQTLLIAGYFTGAFATGKMLEIASMIPVISPMIMPGRIALGEAPMWQVLLGLGLNIVAAVVLIRLGSRIYDRHLLQTGRKIGFKEALTS